KRPQPLVASIQDGVAEAFYGAAGILAQDRSSQAAKVYVRLATYMRPDFETARMLLAEVLEAESQIEEAIDVYRTLSDTSTYNWDARIRIASNLDRIDRGDEAVAMLRQLAAERPQDPTPYITMGDL